MNTIDNSGLSIDTPAQTREKILNGTGTFPGLYQIYGDSINVGPNAPDGQFVDIETQFTQDFLEFLRQIYTSMDPDQAIGRSLDERCAINGVYRNPGSRTRALVNVSFTGAGVSLVGFNTSPAGCFKVSDNAGNIFQLIDDFTSVGTLSIRLFQSAVLGPITPAANSLTTIVTIQLGVTAVNNPTGHQNPVGTLEESDYALRIRRTKSVALPSKGFFDGLYGALVDIEGVTSVNLLENITNTTDGNGIPGHSIWAIVAGGDNDAIAHAIYVKRNAGCGMKGAVSVNVVQVDGSIFTVQFDRPTDEPLWIKFDIAAVTGTVDDDYVRTQLLAQLSYGIGQKAVVSDIVAMVQAIAPNAAISLAGVSLDGVTYEVDLLAPSTVDSQFSVIPAHVLVNGTPG